MYYSLQHFCSNRASGIGPTLHWLEFVFLQHFDVWQEYKTVKRYCWGPTEADSSICGRIRLQSLSDVGTVTKGVKRSVANSQLRFFRPESHCCLTVLVCLPVCTCVVTTKKSALNLFFFSFLFLFCTSLSFSVFLFICPPSLSGAVLRWGYFVHSVRQASPWTLSAAHLSAPSWELCMLRTAAIAAWGWGQESGQWWVCLQLVSVNTLGI